MMAVRLLRLVLAASAALPLPPTVTETTAAERAPRVGQPGKDVIWLPTPDEMVVKMLDLAQVAPGERLVDLGSGDGRIVIAAAKRGALARGIEYDAEMVAHSRRLAAQAGVDVELVQGDIFASDFSHADVVTMFLLDALNERLRPTLLAMKPGTRVVSYRFGMAEWEPDATITGELYDTFLWRIPAQVAGEWKAVIANHPGPALRFEQRFQKLEGRAIWGERSGPLRDAAIRGAVVTFTAADAAGMLHRFEGVADHSGPMMGVVTPVNGGAARLFVATRL